jgi:hypothetical protein
MKPDNSVTNTNRIYYRYIKDSSTQARLNLDRFPFSLFIIGSRLSIVTAIWVAHDIRNALKSATLVTGA